MQDGDALGLLLALTFSSHAPAPPVTPPAVTTTAIGVGSKAWANRTRLSPRKKKVVDELDEMLLELRARVEEAPKQAEEPKWVQTFHKTEAFVDSAALADASMEQLKASLSAIKEIMRELDDEEFILLAVH